MEVVLGKGPAWPCPVQHVRLSAAVARCGGRVWRAGVQPVPAVGSEGATRGSAPRSGTVRCSGSLDRRWGRMTAKLYSASVSHCPGCRWGSYCRSDVAFLLIPHVCWLCSLWDGAGTERSSLLEEEDKVICSAEIWPCSTKKGCKFLIMSVLCSVLICIRKHISSKSFIGFGLQWHFILNGANMGIMILCPTPLQNLGE